MTLKPVDYKVIDDESEDTIVDLEVADDESEDTDVDHAATLQVEHLKFRQNAPKVNQEVIDDESADTAVDQ